MTNDMTHPPRLIAVTGGIGAGKSVVCKVLRVLGYAVYDTDAHARKLMNTHPGLIHALKERFGHNIYTAHGELDRQRLSSIVFPNPTELAALNGIVHATVLEDVERWRNSFAGKTDKVFVETAILYQSGMDAMVDGVWEVTADKDTRIERVMARNNMCRRDVEARIAAQCHDIPANPELPVHLIVNDDSHPVLPQILELLSL